MIPTVFLYKILLMELFSFKMFLRKSLIKCYFKKNTISDSLKF